MKHLDSCPEKPRSPPTARDIEWASGDLGESAGLPLASTPPRAAVAPMDSLKALALGSPAKASGDANPDFSSWVKRRVDTDAANLTMANFELDCKIHRVAGRKTTASKALAALSPLEAMSELYQIVCQIYLRKLHGIIPSWGSSRRTTLLSTSSVMP